MEGWTRTRLSGLGLGVLLLACMGAGCGGASERAVVVYTSQDQVFSEPILRGFTEATGIEVQAVYDSEAVKTVGLANRLLAERRNPRCDLFWSNEELRTRQLAAEDVFEEGNGWTSFGHRSRRLVINTNYLALSDAPRTFGELTNSVWRGKVALAYPLFGTTATHFLALRQSWGEEQWKNWCEALMANEPLLLDGNSVVARMVGRGEAWIGMTDSDDIAMAQREGLPVAGMPLSEDALLVPNTVALVRGRPRPEPARELYEYLQSPAVRDQLIAVDALERERERESESESESESEGESEGERGWRPDEEMWGRILAELEVGTAQMRAIFLR